ncbi:Uu.00g075370.m01.CDS01 [Anthostomella pinea]|uniref:Uu.00g075370.m01.CDS01 n=1 Tax=Anthostomella pinea TaxID=933095 RepID=A0AAI8YLR0_9PEZI|nr:Uu.00g075370.m01.CDS01 [Anthostomella pinea]
MATNTNGNFGQSGDETLSIEELLGSSWPTVLKSCVERNCDGNFRPFHNALSNDSGNNLQANTQALFQALRDQLNAARGRIDGFEQNIGILTQAFNQGIKGMSNNPQREPSSLVSDPALFDREEKDDKKRRRQFRAWLSSARMKINVETRKYNTEYNKILYAVSRLDGTARVTTDGYLAKIYSNPDNPTMWEWQDVDTFFDWLERAYDSHNRSGDASREMDDLKQKNTAFNLFLSEFLALASDLGLDDKVKIEKLKKKVNNELQSAVISVFSKPQNEDFDGWVECYQSLTENIADYAHHTGNKNPFANNNPFNNNSNKNNNKDSNNKNNQTPQHPPQALRRLSTTERQKRIEKGLCLYCGGEGHMNRDCPEAPQLLQSATPARGGGFNLTRPGSAPPGGNLQGGGSNNTNPFRQGHTSDLRIRAIGWRGNADDWPGSTASTPGYNNGYGQQYGHKGNSDQPSRESKDMDVLYLKSANTGGNSLLLCATVCQGGRGKRRNNVTEFVAVTMEVDGHLETLLCFLTELGNENPLILGFPWLQTHNPSIDWQTCVITFCSDFCRNNYFHVRPVQVRGGKKAPNPNQHRKKVQFAETEPLRDCSPDDLKISSVVSFAWFCRQKGVTISRITVEQLEQASLPELKPLELSEHDIQQILTTEGSAKEHKAKLDTRYHTFVDDMFNKHFLNRVTDKDIEKYLKDKEPATVNDIKKKLPPEYHDLIDVFLPSGATTLPEHRSYDHHIDIEPGKSIPNLKTRPMSQSELRVVKKYLDDNMQKKFIRPSELRSAAPLLLARKPGGGVRVCVDYRGLNDITIKNRYPLPLIRETLDALSTSNIFSKLDVIAAFNRIRIAEGDEWKTAFTTRFGLYKTLVTPFGLCNAPSTFQHYINDTLYEFLNRFASAYLHNILIYSKNLKEHRKQVRKVLEALRTANLHIDIGKCEFHTTKTKYLGLIISTDGIGMDPEKVDALLDWESPRNVKDLQHFLGFANFYRRFIRGFSSIARPLTGRLKTSER